jgi:hypothetical protein
MAYEQDIEVYKQKVNFNSPLASNPNKCATCCVGDLIVIIEGVVWVRDWSDDRKEQFAQAVYSPEFVRINPSIFDKQ